MKRIIAKIIFSIILLCAFFQSKAQVNDFAFFNYTQNDGLIGNQVLSITQDDYGYIWLGTKDGISRFDGYQFINFSSQNNDKNSHIVGNYVYQLLRDHNGDILIATETGTCKYLLKEGMMEYYNLERKDGIIVDNYPSDRIFEIDNEVYVFSQLGEMAKLDTTNNIFRNTMQIAFSERKIRYCHKDSKNNFWLISESEDMMYYVNVKGETIYQIDCSKTKFPKCTNTMNCMIELGDNKFMFGYHDGLIEVSIDEDKIYVPHVSNPEDLPTCEVKALYKDQNKNIWVGTNAENLRIISGINNKIYTIECNEFGGKFGMLSSTVNCITEDNNGLIWFGTWIGASCLELNSSKKFHNISANTSPKIIFRNSMSHFAQRKDSVIAIASDGGGLAFWRLREPQSIVQYSPLKNPSDKKFMDSPSALSVCFDNKGNCYSGGYNRRLIKISSNLKDVTAYPYNPDDEKALKCNFIQSTICDSKNRIWVLTNGGGLELFNPQTQEFKKIRRDKYGNTLCSEYGISLTELNDGRILVGTYNNLSIYDADNDILTTHINTPDTNTISHNWINCALVDSKERLWIATSAGLNLYDTQTNTAQRILKESGLESLVINSILEDNQGYLWLGTAQGLVKFDPNTLKVIRTFHMSDGLISDNFLTGSALKTLEGYLIFGTNEGMVYFRPEEIKKDERINTPDIVGMLINYKRVLSGQEDSPFINSIEYTEEIELQEHQSTFTIEYASMNYINSSGIKYYCYMQGYDKEWIDFGNRREATFTNLYPGDYVFMVKCKNEDGTESKVKSLKIKILPPWYLTTWAIILWILLTIILVPSFFYLRIKNLQKSKNKLEALVEERTKEIKESNTLLAQKQEELLIQSEEIITQRDELALKFEELAYSQHQILEQKNQIARQMRTLIILNTLGQKIIPLRDKQEILIQTYSHVLMMFKCDMFALGNYYNNTLEYTIFTNELPEGEEFTLPLVADTPEQICFKQNEIVNVEPDQINKCTLNQKFENQYKTISLVPLMAEEKCNGILAFMCKEQNQYYEADIANIQMVSQYLSIVLDRLHSFKLLQSKNNSINGSIRYAKNIQDTILVDENTLNNYFESLLIYRPKDIVSGDFYWYKDIITSDNKHYTYLSVIDCTGHGVPGAFMSMIANTIFNDIIKSNNCIEPKDMLIELSKEFVANLRNHTADGMELSLCRIELDQDNKPKHLLYSAAKSPLYYYNAISKELQMIKASRVGINGEQERKKEDFDQFSTILNQGDMIYMISDGIIDQNNDQRTRFGRNRFQDVIKECINLPIQDAKEYILNELISFQGNEEQRDDITVIGVRM